VKKVIIQLESLSCPSCIKKIETPLMKTAGVDSVEIFFNSSRVKAQFDEASIEAIQLSKMITQLG